ncbi:hypothetical protein Q3W71_25470 [Micromonospora sp. C28SCA-DRY-2]|uniref:hypothetical protein n=1 Tax=Micromonospora sp. C28SCA-DRY-2 TaxID=3059522 RepID=UPI002675666E|nr:hypothetical protein [Micromonospora sp. C28SCA-DRY-2]MDO3705021.1 hypothetical protein [Micromonospora sp. C28SCA-DRY-2]
MESGDGFTPVFVSYHQFQVGGGAERGDDLGLYTVGDDLLQLTGRSQLTVLTGPHTAHVGVRLAVLGSPPPDDDHDWEAAAEATIWLPDGRVSVCGLMGDCPDPFRQVAAGPPGLFRVRVQARDRRPEDSSPAPGAPERYAVTVWPVNEDLGFRTVRRDGLRSSPWAPRPARAAGWAMVRLVTLANPDPREVARRRLLAVGQAPADPPAGRVAVRRHRTIPGSRATELLRHPAELLGARTDGDEFVLPAGGLEIRLRVLPPLSQAEGGPREQDADHLRLSWRWAPRPGSSSDVPDTGRGSVDVLVTPGDGRAELAVVHHGVRAPDAVLLGLVWDHLLDRLGGGPGDGESPHPWEPLLADLAARAAARAADDLRRRREYEARRWGGTPPSDRLREVAANTIGLALLDRALLDALAEAAPAVQRAVARWATRQAYALAGLAEIDWIVPALAALDRGEPLPPPFDDDHRAWQRLWADGRVPATTVTSPDGTPNCSAQAMAFPAIRAAVHPDPLAGAVDTVYFAALTAGDQRPALLAAARAALADLGGDR